MPAGKGPIRKTDLSPSCRRLLELMQEVNFGTIERLPVRGGEPVVEPLPEVERVYKIGGENGPRPTAQQQDFELKDEVIEFFEYLRTLGTCIVRRVEICHGLPRVMAVREPKED